MEQKDAIKKLATQARDNGALIVSEIGSQTVWLHDGGDHASHLYLSGPMGMAPSVALGVDEPKMPKVFAVSENYPNPFNPTTTFAYELPVAAGLQVRGFDMTGRMVMNHNDGIKPAGKYNFVLDAAGLASGVYFCMFSTGYFQTSQKVILLK